MPYKILFNLALFTLIATSMLFPMGVRAHGLPMKVHGGLVATEMDMGFEIYTRDNRIVLYVTDHDSPFDTQLFTAEVQDNKSTVTLESAAGGLLISQKLRHKPNLRLLKVTLSAKVLPTPIRLDFSRSP